MANFRFVDVSGVGNSGKSAVVDLLREVENVYAPEYWFEFNILRVPNGILDLRHRIVDDWSPTRTHYAIRAFGDVVEKMGVDPHWWNIFGMLRSTSQRYDRRFQNQFRKLAVEFVSSFIRARYLAEWPHDHYFESDARRMASKVFKRLGLRRQMRREVLVVDGSEFDSRANQLMDRLYGTFVPESTKIIVLNNGFEPYNPIPALNMLSESRHIVVTRDPRDIYVSGRNRHRVEAQDQSLIAFDNDGMNKSFLATDDVRTFVERTRVSHRNLFKGDDPRILRLRFEDLCWNYESTSEHLFKFLGIPVADHVRPHESFRPEESGQNIGLWRRYSKPLEISYIEKELSDLLVSLPEAMA